MYPGVSLYAGATKLSATSYSTPHPGSGEFVTWWRVYEIGATHAEQGETLSIRLDSGNNFGSYGQVDFDSVSLLVVPEPSTAVLLAIALAGLAAAGRWRSLH